MMSFFAGVRALLDAIPTPMAIAGMLALAALQIVVAPDHSTALAGNVISALAGWMAHRAADSTGPKPD